MSDGVGEVVDEQAGHDHAVRRPRRHLDSHRESASEYSEDEGIPIGKRGNILLRSAVIRPNADHDHAHEHEMSSEMLIRRGVVPCREPSIVWSVQYPSPSDAGWYSGRFEVELGGEPR